MDFATTRILREINFWDSRSAKSIILTITNIEALNLDIHYFLQFFKAEIYQIYQIFALLEFTKLTSRKICVIQKS